MYEITFVNGEIWHGGDIERSKWNEMPNKPIRTIHYQLLNHSMIFENYEAYNHIVERTHLILNKEKEFISKIILMAKKGDIVYSCIFDLLSNKVYQETCEFGKEYYKQATSGWKEGLKNKDIIYKIEN